MDRAVVIVALPHLGRVTALNGNGPVAGVVPLAALQEAAVADFRTSLPQCLAGDAEIIGYLLQAKLLGNRVNVDKTRSCGTHATGIR